MNNKIPRLRRIHSDESLEQGIARFSLKFRWAKSNREIIKSLQAGKVESLKVKSDGRILNGNVRCKVLEERNFDINSLEREIVE